jgi:hypothetical protein
MAGLSLVSEAVKVSVPGFGLLELTVKLTLPFESVVAVALSAPALPPLITNPESPELVKVTVSPDTALFESSLTVMEIVAVDEPSAGTELLLTEKSELLVLALLLAKTGKAKKKEENKRVRIKIITLLFISRIVCIIRSRNQTRDIITVILLPEKMLKKYFIFA